MPQPALLTFWTPALALVALTASLVGLGPQPFLARLRKDRLWLGPGLRLGAAAGAAGLAVMFGSVGLGRPFEAGSLGVAAVCLAAVAIVDHRHLVIPDLYVAILLVLAILQTDSLGAGSFGALRAAGGAALGGGLLILVRWGFKRMRGLEGLGLGDVKLMIALGALLGPQGTLWTIVGGAGVGIAWFFFSPARRVQGGKAPFGSAVAAPAMIAIAWSWLAR